MAVVKRDKKRTGKRKAAPHEWIRKRQRNCGQSYKTIKKVLEVAEKQIKSSCDVLKCKYKRSTKFTEEVRLGFEAQITLLQASYATLSNT